MRVLRRPIETATPSRRLHSKKADFPPLDIHPITARIFLDSEQPQSYVSHQFSKLP